MQKAELRRFLSVSVSAWPRFETVLPLQHALCVIHAVVHAMTTSVTPRPRAHAPLPMFMFMFMFMFLDTAAVSRRGLFRPAAWWSFWTPFAPTFGVSLRRRGTSLGETWRGFGSWGDWQIRTRTRILWRARKTASPRKRARRR